MNLKWKKIINFFMYKVGYKLIDGLTDLSIVVCVTYYNKPNFHKWLVNHYTTITFSNGNILYFKFS